MCVMTMQWEQPENHCVGWSSSGFGQPDRHCHVSVESGHALFFTRFELNVETDVLIIGDGEHAGHYTGGVYGSCDPTDYYSCSEAAAHLPPQGAFFASSIEFREGPASQAILLV